MPIRPFALGRDALHAGPSKAGTADANAIAQRPVPIEHQIQKEMRGIDNDRAWLFAAAIFDELTFVTADRPAAAVPYRHKWTAHKPEAGKHSPVVAALRIRMRAVGAPAAADIDRAADMRRVGARAPPDNSRTTDPGPAARAPTRCIEDQVAAAARPQFDNSPAQAGRHVSAVQAPIRCIGDRKAAAARRQFDSSPAQAERHGSAVRAQTRCIEDRMAAEQPRSDNSQAQIESRARDCGGGPLYRGSGRAGACDCEAPCQLVTGTGCAAGSGTGACR